jgi:recombination protein RecA
LRRLEATVRQLQRRWGPKAIRKLEAAKVEAPIPHIPTGFSKLDKALGIGGIPRSRITELLGPLTSGKTTIALKIVAHAQDGGDQAAYVDLSQTFDADYAFRCGVNLAQLVIVQPHSAREALAIAHSLVSSQGLGVLVFDSVASMLGESPSPQLLSEALRQLVGGLADSACALVFLTSLCFGGPSSKHNYPSGFALSHYASVRLLVERERWIKRYGDVRGYGAEIEVLKNKLAPAGKRVRVSITFNGTVNGNGT